MKIGNIILSEWTKTESLITTWSRYIISNNNQMDYGVAL